MDGSVAVASLEAGLTNIRSSKDTYSTDMQRPNGINRHRRSTSLATNDKKEPPVSEKSKNELPIKIELSDKVSGHESRIPPAPAAKRAHVSHSHNNVQTWAQYFEQIELKFTLSLLGSLLILYQIPASQEYAAQILEIQYINPETGLAGIGKRDCYFLLLALVTVVMIRALCVKYVLIFTAKHLAGIHKHKAQVRFAEQGYNLLYFSCSVSVGLKLLMQSSYSSSTRELWANWPHYEMDPMFKAYYLFQFAYWIGQVYVIHVEEQRKDHYQMLTHHIVTLFLVQGAYFYYYTRIGHVVLLIMDFVDAQFSFAKIMKYCGYEKTCDVAFGVFLLGWISLRHATFCYVTWSASIEAFKVIENRCYYHPTSGELIRCFSPRVHWTLVTLLGVLQVITIIWFTMILKIAYKILKGGSAEDSRSDDEDED